MALFASFMFDSQAPLDLLSFVSLTINTSAKVLLTILKIPWIFLAAFLVTQYLKQGYGAEAVTSRREREVCFETVADPAAHTLCF